MFNTLLTAFKIDSTYKINVFIYNLRKLPFIIYLLPYNIYSREDFKDLVRIINILIEIIFGMVKKSIYLIVILTILSLYVKENLSESFFNALFFLTVLGATNVTSIVRSNTKKYYSVRLMNMNAKEYELSHYTLYIATTFILFFLVLSLFSILFKSLAISPFIISLFIIESKIIGDTLELKYFNKTSKVLSANKIYGSILCIVCLLGAFLLPYLHFNIALNYLLILIPILSLISIFCIRFLLKNNTYSRMYKKIVTIESINLTQINSTNITALTNANKLDLKNITLSKNIQNKKGYDYFNSIFIDRHKKILSKPAKITALIFLAISIATIVCTFIFPTIKEPIHKATMISLPFLVFIMYILNTGVSVTQAMFFNCDHSMLTYKFYRKPETIINLFKLRLKTIMKISLIPASVIAITLPVLLFITGGTDNILIYFSLFLSVIFLSLFFSVHNLVLYYLLQPYDINMVAKSSAYNIINFITYMVCYMFVKIKINETSTIVFSLSTIAATFIYICIALLLTYKYAPKTFKLK